MPDGCGNTRLLLESSDDCLITVAWMCVPMPINALTKQTPQRARPRRRWLRRLAMVVVAVVVGVAGPYAYLEISRQRDIQAAIAEADLLDPGWRFDEMQAARATVPDAENSAIIVLA